MLTEGESRPQEGGSPNDLRHGDPDQYTELGDETELRRALDEILRRVLAMDLLGLDRAESEISSRVAPTADELAAAEQLCRAEPAMIRADAEEMLRRRCACVAGDPSLLPSMAGGLAAYLHLGQLERGEVGRALDDALDDAQLWCGLAADDPAVAHTRVGPALHDAMGRDWWSSIGRLELAAARGLQDGPGATNGARPTPEQPVAVSDPWAALDAAKTSPTAAAQGLRTIRLRAASTFTMRATNWAWQDRIPLGELTLLGGREGEGKSTVAYDRIAAITRGTLPGDLYGTPRNVAVAATEDSWEQTIVPRLIAAGADLARVFHVEVVGALGAETVLSLPLDLPATELVLREHDVGLLLLDPLMSRLDGRLDTHKDAEVRRALEPVKAMADRLRCAVVGLIHVNKSRSTDPLDALMGSRAFTALARSVLFVMRDPDDTTRRTRLLGLAKGNLVAEDEVPTLTFVIESRPVGEDPDSGKAIAAGAASWGDDSQRSVRSALETAREDPEARSALREACVWLTDYLAEQGGVAWSSDAKQAAGKADKISERTLRRAATELKLEITEEGYPKRSRWSLPVGPSIEE